MFLKNSFSPLHFTSDYPHFVLDIFSGSCGSKTLSLEKDAHVVCVAVFDEAQIDFNLKVQGDSSHLEFFGIFVGSVKSKIITSLLGNSSFAQINLFCIVLDDVDMQVEGNISFGKNVEGAEGHLEEEQFLLGTAKNLLVRPILDVHSYRVKASHGAKIHTLDKHKLFYMMSKGLSLRESQKIVVQATLESLFERIPDEEKKSILQGLLDKIF